jgi:uncharacterized protein (TIGR02246 family)
MAKKHFAVVTGFIPLILLVGIIIGSALFSARPVFAQTASGINQLKAQWIQHWNAKELEALIALYADDAILLPASGSQIVGKDRIKEHFKQILDSAPSIHIQLMSDGTDSSGDLAFDSGTYEDTLAGGGATFGNSAVFNSAVFGGGQTKTVGSYLVVARKQAGKWLFSQQAITEKTQPPSGR